MAVLAVQWTLNKLSHFAIAGIRPPLISESLGEAEPMALSSRFSLALLALSLSWLPAPVGAEPADQPKPAKQLKVMETPRGLLEAATFGEMLGLPDWMAMSLSLVNQPMGNITGSKQRTFRSIDMQAIDWSLGSGLSKEDSDKDEFDRWSFRSSLATYIGVPPYFSEDIGAAFPLQALEDTEGLQQGFWLQGLWLQRDSENLSLKFGNNLSLDPLVESPVYNAYVNSTINSTLNLSLPGYPTVPFSSLGASLQWRANDRLTVNYGGYQLSNQRTGFPAGRWKGWRFNLDRDDGFVQALRLDWALSETSGEPLLICMSQEHPDVVVRHHQGCKRPMRLENKLPDPVLQLGAVSGSWRFPQINNPSRWENRANSIFASATLPVPFALGHGSRLWGSAVIGTEPAINPVPLFLEGGWITQGVIRQRPFDSVVLGLTRSSFSPSLGRASGQRMTYEGMIELGYILQLSQELALQPGVQVIVNPEGTGDNETLVVPGLQVSFNW